MKKIRLISLVLIAILTVFILTQKEEEIRIGGSFELTNQDGVTITQKDIDKDMLIFFGFTNCPDICPTTLNKISLIINNIDDNLKEKFQPILITVDPERDTPEVLKEYLSNFEGNFIGLTGNEEDVNQVLNKFKIYASKIEMEGMDGYMVNHSTLSYLVDKDGFYKTHFNYDETVDQIIQKLKDIY